MNERVHVEKMSLFDKQMQNDIGGSHFKPHIGPKLYILTEAQRPIKVK